MIKQKVDEFKMKNKNHVSIFEPFSLKELNTEIKKLKKQSAVGGDKIHNLYIINASDSFKKQILHLVNETIRQNEIPSEWKTTIVKMIPKKKAGSTNPKDYRPISITSCLGKLAERLINMRLTKFIEENNLIVKFQAGFRRHRQTRDNLIHLIQKGIESFNRKKKICAIFFDIQSAFDKIWHNGLIFKLLSIKIPIYIIKWCIQFLDSRSFTVNLNGCSSNKYKISAGVPQGAVLSPLLFAIYINDIPSKYVKNSKYSLLFADDLVSYFIFKSNKSVERTINNYLKDLENWLSKWRLLMAPQKCNYIIFKNNARVKENFKINLFKTELEEVKNLTFLGLRFDQQLKFKEQVDYLIDKCSNRLNCLKVLSSKAFKLTTKTLVQIYSTLIRSVLEYSSMINCRISKKNYKKLQAIQNSALRSIFKIPFMINSNTIEIISGVPQIKDRFKDLNEKYVNQILTNENPIIKPLCEEFLVYEKSRNLRYKTFLCDHKDLLTKYLVIE